MKFREHFDWLHRYSPASAFSLSGSSSKSEISIRAIWFQARCFLVLCLLSSQFASHITGYFSTSLMNISTSRQKVIIHVIWLRCINVAYPLRVRARLFRGPRGWEWRAPAARDPHRVRRGAAAAPTRLHGAATPDRKLCLHGAATSRSTQTRLAWLFLVLFVYARFVPTTTLAPNFEIFHNCNAYQKYDSFVYVKYIAVNIEFIIEWL